jgi:NAD+ kinase
MSTPNPTPERKLKNVLVVLKKSSYQVALDSNDQHTLQLIEQGDETVAFYKPAHYEQEATIALVRSVLNQKGIKYQEMQRGELKGDPTGFDAVITIGGDGTFLDVSHSLQLVPLLGVNPTSTSYGHFCLANRSSFATVVDEIDSGVRQPIRLFRLEAAVNGVVVPEPILNEVSFGHVNWRSMSRYLVTVRGVREEHKSNGMFIGPASGSTGSLSSAGAPALPIAARQFQFRVILPWLPPGTKYALAGGILEETEEVTIKSKMPRADFGIDGDQIVYPLQRGDKLVVRASKKDLLAYVSPDANDAAVK